MALRLMTIHIQWAEYKLNNKKKNIDKKSIQSTFKNNKTKSRTEHATHRIFQRENTINHPELI